MTGPVLTSVRMPEAAAPQRLAALSVLPVFLPLEGRRAVVAGGSSGAAWKAELVAAAGAAVDLYAPDPSAEMAALVAGGAAAGSLALHVRPWTPADLAGAALAICDAETDAEAAAFHAAATAGGVPVNVVDKPAFCTVQFGAVVNRSPVVVAISTAGTAPILGQAVRRRIETLLPPSLAAWGAAAARLRADVMDRLAPGRQRREFWERFAELAFAAAPPPEDDAAIVAATAEGRAGRVTLVGAGPGDAEFLTLKAVRALQGCDVILFDDLVSDDVLELARREAKRICVGKRGARESCRQEDITALMIRLAREGRQVVRLKSGDPMIFGRAGEEIEAVRAAGIEVAVVPGVTAASAMAAALGISLTHRDHAQIVSFVTGHSRHGRLPDTVVADIAGAGRTAIVYMGGRTADALVDRLVEAGVDAALPSVAVWSVARPDQRVWAGPLHALAEAIAMSRATGPLLIGIGGTFASAAVAEPRLAAEGSSATCMATG